MTACISTSAFLGQAEYQAQMLGVKEMTNVFVHHPVSNATPQEMESKAAESYDVALECLRKGASPPATWVRQAAQGCGS